MRGTKKVLHGWEHETLEAKINRALRMSYTERYREMVEFAQFIEAAKREQSSVDHCSRSDEKDVEGEETFRSVQVLRLRV